MDTTTLSILVVIGIIYLIFMVGVVLFFVNKRKGKFNQTIDVKPVQTFQSNEEIKK